MALPPKVQINAWLSAYTTLQCCFVENTSMNKLHVPLINYQKHSEDNCLAFIKPLSANSYNMQLKHLSPYFKEDSQGLEKDRKCEVNFVASLTSQSSTDCVPSPECVDEFRHARDHTRSSCISLKSKICPHSEPRDSIFKAPYQWCGRRLQQAHLVPN